ncbi:MAG: hypothetical protein O6850_02675 [Acidobacteria bacterium]|nr:hypothetical protein [Acidobacteriota bacterium]
MPPEPSTPQNLIRPGLVRLLGVVLLSVWLAGTLMEWYVATQNFKTVDRVLTAPTEALGEQSKPLEAARLRVLFRYLASELNRHYFHSWGWAQMALGLALVGLWVGMKLRDRASWALLGSMLLIVVGLHFAVMPQLVELGRTLDFVSRDLLSSQLASQLAPPWAPQMDRFWKLHAAFTGLDGVKLLLGLGLLARQLHLIRK